MRSLTIALVIAAAALLVLGLSGTALAFHNGGVAHCDGCHSMHNSADNPIGLDRNGNPTGAIANAKLLKGTDASSTCLNCHKRNGGYGVLSTDGSNKTQGGDFAWLTFNFTKSVHGHLNTYFSENNGHNIIAADYGLVMDTNPSNASAPGGTYQASKLGCTSCHDAHGQVLDGTKGGSGAVEVSGSYDAEPVNGGIRGNYRILGDALYEAGDHDGDGYDFSNAAPVAEANGSNGYAVDYGYGMSEWCANCHTDFLNSGTKHVAGAGNGLLDGMGTNYNSYVKTGDFTGTQATSYDALVPFERGTGADHTTLDPANAINGGPGPAAGAQVMCLTCHRAHASANNNAGRWDFETELIAESTAIENAPTATAVPFYSNGTAVDVATKYGHNQRSLCNKCHVQD